MTANVCEVGYILHGLDAQSDVQKACGKICHTFQPGMVACAHPLQVKLQKMSWKSHCPGIILKLVQA